MGGLTTTDAVYLALAFVVPGFVFSSVKEQFLTGRERQPQSLLIRCLTYSAINYAIFSAPIYFIASVQMGVLIKAISWSAIILIGPFLLGVISGFSSRNDWLVNLLRRINISIVHIVPTSWDWKFGRMSSGQWVLATLKDGTQFAGFYGNHSFGSSDPKERDLYIQEVFEIDDSDKWTSTGAAVLIVGDTLQSVEFWPSEDTNEREGDADG